MYEADSVPFSVVVVTIISFILMTPTAVAGDDDPTCGDGIGVIRCAN